MEGYMIQDTVSGMEGKLKRQRGGMLADLKQEHLMTELSSDVIKLTASMKCRQEWYGGKGEERKDEK